jgi:2-oxoglutarate ferredoxin oxidoreductase subunit beta
MTDDGFNLGVLYKGKRPPYAIEKRAALEVAELEREFML